MDTVLVAKVTVVAVGITLLAMSVLKMMRVGRRYWQKRNDSLPSSDRVEGDNTDVHLASGTIPAILFRRNGALGDKSAWNIFLNNEGEKVLGFTREELQSDPNFLTWLMHPEDRQDYMKGDAQLAEPNAELVFDHRFKHRSGSYRWLRITMKRVDDESGALKEIVCCGLDVTDLKEAEEELASILSTDPWSVNPEDEELRSGQEVR